MPARVGPPWFGECGSGDAGQPATPEREALAGLIERVAFHSPESGFCVLKVKVRGQREPVTVVGAAAATTAGEFVQASGALAPTSPRPGWSRPAGPRAPRSAPTPHG